MERELADTLEALHADAFGWALHCCTGDHNRAEEVLQNAYLKLVRGQLQRTGGSQFKTWWFGVIRLTAHEEARRQWYRDSLLGKLWHQTRADSSEISSTPARQLEQDEQTLQLRQALATLPARQAEALHLVFYQDLSLSEAAVVMKISLGSARQHYERGKARLRTVLSPSSPTHKHEL